MFSDSAIRCGLFVNAVLCTIMPKSRICPLHIAASLSQLEAYCRLDPNINNSSILEKNILAVLFAAEKAKFEDEEQAYILFSRACTLYNRFKHIKKGIVSEEVCFLVH